jgi:peptidoglycan/LPS O-acetylase OafA/YrhL
MEYRAEIDGLRAIAVIAVVAFHSGLPFVSGGFVGVDMFFVISGFLLTRLISKDIDEKCFSLAKFYERRVRRIFPALVAMLVSLWLFGILFWTPRELIAFSKESLAATLALSNFLFWKERGYFDAPALEKPLLHTWSLGVEEQFYVLLPVILQLSSRDRSPFSPRTIVAMIAAASFGLSCWMARYDPDAAFYLLPARAWELLLGSLVSFKVTPFRNLLIATHGSLLGICLVTAPIFMGNDVGQGSFFGVLSACLGTALIVGAGPTDRSSISALLSMKIPHFVGRISYSVYLWHWPLIAILGRSIFLHHPMSAGFQALIVSVTSLVAGYISWRYIETPFRSKYRRSLILSAASFAVAISIFASLSVVLLDGIPSRFSVSANTLDSSMTAEKSPAHFRSNICYIWSGSKFSDFRPDECLRERNDVPNYLILGDSHAAHLWIGLSSVFPNINWLQATASGCLPSYRPTGADRCVRMMHLVFDEFLLSHKVDCVILSARWAPDLAELAQTIDWAKTHGIPLLLMGAIQEYDAPLPGLLMEASRLNEPGLPEKHLVMSRRSVDHSLALLAKEKNITYVSVQDILCGRGVCEQWAAKGVPLQFDYGHLTREGSMLLAESMKNRHLLPYPQQAPVAGSNRPH